MRAVLHQVHDDEHRARGIVWLCVACDLYRGRTGQDHLTYWVSGKRYLTGRCALQHSLQHTAQPCTLIIIGSHVSCCIVQACGYSRSFQAA